MWERRKRAGWWIGILGLLSLTFVAGCLQPCLTRHRRVATSGKCFVLTTRSYSSFLMSSACMWDFLADEKTPCLKVMLSRETPATERALPKSIEGYPVWRR